MPFALRCRQYSAASWGSRFRSVKARAGAAAAGARALVLGLEQRIIEACVVGAELEAATLYRDDALQLFVRQKDAQLVQPVKRIADAAVEYQPSQLGIIDA